MDFTVRSRLERNKPPYAFITIFVIAMLRLFEFANESKLQRSAKLHLNTIAFAIL